MPATTQGKEAALKALKERREKNRGQKYIDNGSLYAGSPMYFYCLTCDDEFSVPENYVSRSKLCRECQALKELGWLE